MNVKMQGLTYRFDEQTGDTAGVELSYQGYEGGNVLNTIVVLTSDDLESDKTLDDLVKSDFDKIARKKMKSWI